MLKRLFKNFYVMLRIWLPIYLSLHLSPLNADVEIAIDWEGGYIRKIPAEFFSLNHSYFFETNHASIEAWADGIEYMKPGAIRFHHETETFPRWYSPTTDDWNYEKIETDLKNKHIDHAGTLLNIPGWPQDYASPETGRLRKESIQRYISLCGRLISHIRMQLQSEHLSIEIPNEKERLYKQDTKSAQEYRETLGSIYKSLKTQFPNITIGGPAYDSIPSPQEINALIQNSSDNLDFISFHFYPTGDTSTKNHSLIGRFNTAAKRITNLSNFISTLEGKHPKLYLTEFNINFDSRNPDKRMTSHESAIFDIFFLIKLMPIKNLAATYAFNDMGNKFGKMDSTGKLRPSAYAYHILNEKFIGDLYKTNIDNNDIAFAAIIKNGAKRIAISNPSDQIHNLLIRSEDTDTIFDGIIFDKSGLSPIRYTAGKLLTISPMSAILLWESSD